MNNKDFIAALSNKMGMDSKETQIMTNKMVDCLASVLEENSEVAVSGFGSFEVKKKNERVIIHPSTGKKMLVPPKLTVNFKLSKTLKVKAKSKVDLQE